MNVWHRSFTLCAVIANVVLKFAKSNHVDAGLGGHGTSNIPCLCRWQSNALLMQMADAEREIVGAMQQVTSL
jgi:hypothetical protein